MSWGSSWFPVPPQLGSIVHWSAEWFIFSLSGSLASLSCPLSELTWFGLFLVSWVLGLVEVVFPPTEPLLLLFFILRLLCCFWPVFFPSFHLGMRDFFLDRCWFDWNVLRWWDFINIDDLQWLLVVLFPYPSWPSLNPSRSDCLDWFCEIWWCHTGVRQMFAWLK